MQRMGRDVADFVAALVHPHKSDLLAVREVILSASPDIQEGIKWNAPSFAKGDTDRITLGIDKSGIIRVVLHRGATAKTPPGFAFEGPADLVQLAAPDRGILRFSSAAAVDNRAQEIGELFRRWLEID